jgi:hypothetical protein
MGIKNIYERFIWFDTQVRRKKYPNATSLAGQFEISSKKIWNSMATKLTSN